MTDALWDIVIGSRQGVLATLGVDGVPQQSNIYYLVDRPGETIRFSTTSVRMKGRNLLRHGSASLHVAGRNFLNYAVVSGPVSVVTPISPDDDAVDALFEIHQGMGANPVRQGFGEEMIANHRVAVELSVQRIYGQIVDREPRFIEAKGDEGTP